MTGKISYSNFIFIPVFFSFYILFKAFGIPDLLLTHFSGRPISIATTEELDIGLRVSQFYKGILFLAFLLPALTKLTDIFQKFIPREELQLMNGLSLAGFCLLFFRLIGADINPSIHIIFALLGIVSIGSVFHQVKKRTETNYTVAFLWSSLLGVALFFLQWQLSLLLSLKVFLSLPITLLFSGSVFYLLSTNQFVISYRILKSTFPLVFLPLLSFIAMEGVMILNQRSIFITQAPVYFAGLITILVVSFYSYKKLKGAHSGVSHEKILFKSWIPWMLAGMFCLAFYFPVVKVDVDIFENANNILPLHQWFNFGKVPLIDSFNAHTIADFGAGWIYSVFNGLDPMGYFVYRFLVQVIVLILIYFMVYKMTDDGFLALWLTLAYPYTQHLIPSYFNLVPLPIIAFIMLYEKQTVSRYMFYFCSMLFMIFWRVDLGMSVVIAGGLSFIFLAFFVPTFKINGRILYRGILFTVSIIFVLFLMALFQSGAHLFVVLKDILGYLSSVQSYGVKDLSITKDLQFYSLYFILPSVIILIIASTIYNIRLALIKENHLVIALVIIFFGIFYLSNFQRGLVRHTLFEQWNMALTSYGFFIIAVYTYLLSLKHQIQSRFLIFFIVSTLLITNYIYREPDLKTNNNYYSLTEKIYASPFAIPKSEKINRVVEESSIIKGHVELKNWLDAKFPKATFVDFSNSPMLYYYTDRIVPSYFLQIPHTAHNEYLQKRFIEDLNNYNVPVSVFSNVPSNFWDNLDGIPNTLRHYRIAEYLYREYKPALIIDGHSIWVKKNIPIPVENKLYSVNLDSLIAGMESENVHPGIADRTYIDYKISSPVSYGGKVYATISFNAKFGGNMEFYYKSGSNDFNGEQKVSLNYLPGENDLFVMLDKLDRGEKLSDIKFELQSNAELSFSDIRFFGAENYFDHYSGQPASCSLKWIPFIWGQYDANAAAGKIQLQQNVLSAEQAIQKNAQLKIDFPPVKQKEDGNYLRLTMKSEALGVPGMTVRYGSNDRINGSFSFTLKNDSVYHDYLIRISSQFGWYNNENTWITVLPSANTEIKSADILSGD